MKFTIENVGPIKRAQMEFGDLTILCGKNNTGKTYITYNTFNFLDAIRYFLTIDVDNQLAVTLLEKGKVSVDLSAYFENYPIMFKLAMDNWVKNEAWRQMASHKDFYSKTRMNLDFDHDDLQKFIHNIEIKVHPPITKNCILHIQKERSSNDVDFIIENSGNDLPDVDVLRKHLNGFLSFVFNSYFPDAFIITCERTGVACFRPSFVYSPPQKVLSERKDNYDEDAPHYPRPMQKDWRFVVEFKDARLEKSFIAEKHPSILNLFSEICGGAYSLDEDTVLFEPQNAQGTKLTTTECSNTVRSLMELNFYLKHKAKEHQVLIIDEPELNLHPENQRKMARLLAMLANAGIYIAITTHSDYIIREFNTLIMLSQDKASVKKIIKKYKYCSDELLKPERVRCYVASDNTVNPMDISPKFGIEVTSFDDTISQVNQIQQTILFGAE